MYDLIIGQNGHFNQKNHVAFTPHVFTETHAQSCATITMSFYSSKAFFLSFLAPHDGALKKLSKCIK